MNTVSEILAASRDDCIAWLKNFDMHGLYSDEDLASEDCRPMTTAEARLWILWYRSWDLTRDPFATAAIELAREHGIDLDSSNGPELKL